MRKVSLFLIILCVGFFSHNVFAEVKQTIHWQEYSSSVFDQAKKTQRFILLYGKSETCHWCQEMDKKTWTSVAVVERVNKSFIPVKLDVETQYKIGGRYRIASLPTILILDENNRTIKILTGFISPEFMDKQLKQIAENYIKLKNDITSKQAEIIKQNQSQINITL